MTNTPEKNLRFSIAWNETNLRYLLGESPLNLGLIEKTKQNIAEAKATLSKIPHPFWPGHFLTA
jgi:hypothetical protein